MQLLLNDFTPLHFKLTSSHQFHFPERTVNDPKALNMNGGQTVHGGQIGENIHNQPQNPVYHQYYGKRMIGKCFQFLSAFMAF